MSERAVLILGAGVMQLPAIRAARSIGVTSYVVDGNPHAPGAALADNFTRIDLKEKEELIRHAEGISHLSGVFTAGTDFSASVAYVRERLGLPGLPYAVALDASEKGRMRRRFAEAGVPSPAFRTITPDEPVEPQLRAAYGSVGVPGVVKPVDNMGARGVRLVRREAELSEAVENARSHARGGVVIYEEWIDGREFSIDALVYEGRLTITGVADRHIYFDPYFVEMGHTLPAALSQEEEETLITTFEAGVRALGIEHGAAKGDVFLRRSGGGAVGEIAARLSGGYMSGWTYPYATGVPLTEAGLRLALGEDPRPLLREKRRHTSAERAVISIPGVVREIEGTQRVGGMEELRELFVRALPGDAVAPPRNNVEKCANIIVVGRSREEALSAAARALRGLLVRLEPNRPETDRYLFDLRQDGTWAWYRTLFAAATAELPALSARIRRSRGRSDPWVTEALQRGTLAIRPEKKRLSEDEHWSGFSSAAAMEYLLASDVLREVREADPLYSTLLHRAVALGGVQAAVYIQDSLRESAGESAGRWLSLLRDSLPGGE